MNRNRTVSYADTDEELFREQMRSSAQGDGASPRTFAYLLDEAHQQGVWKSLGFSTFRAFLEASEEDGGLNMTEERLMHVAYLAARLPLARELLDGDPLAHTGDIGRGRDRNDNIIPTSGQGTSESYLRRRLKRDRPDLYEQVETGELKANAAAVEAGWQSRKLSVAVDNPESAARTLRKHMNPDDLGTLAKLLTESE